MHQPIRFRRIRVRITRAGWLYVAVALLVGGAAVNTTNNMLYLITAGLLSLMALSGMVAYRALRHLELELLLPEEWYAGQEAAACVRVTNRRRWLPTFLLRVARGDEEVLLVEILPGECGEGSLNIIFPSRGRYPLGELVVTSAFPFAFFHRGGVMTLPRDVLVYPRPVFPDEAASVGSGGHDGGLSSSRRGVGGDFHGTRAYLPGDSLARVDWKAWGRLGQVMVKEFEEESAPPLVLTLESVPGPGLEERLSQLTGLILQANKAGRAVALQLEGDTIGPGRGYPFRERQLRALALYSGSGHDYDMPSQGGAVSSWNGYVRTARATPGASPLGG